MDILVIPCSFSSRYLFEMAFREEFKVHFLTRLRVETELRKRSGYNLIVLDSRFQDLYGVYILEILEKLSPKIPKLVIAECGEIRNELKKVSRNGDNYIIRPPRIKYLRDLSKNLINKKLDELDVNKKPQLESLADAIDDVEEVTRGGAKEHYIKVIELAEEIYSLLEINSPKYKNILTNFSCLHDVNRTRVKNSILDDVVSDKDISEKDYLNVFCGVGKIDGIVKANMTGWGHFYLENYNIYRKKELEIYKKSEMGVVPSDIVAVADAYDIHERKFRKQEKNIERPAIIKELKETDILNPLVLDSLSKAA